MVQKPNPQPSRPGRRPGFDREAVISAAIAPFWSKGFEATTLEELEAATGVDRSTIYNSFGGKKGLHYSAAMAYVDLSQDRLFAPLTTGSAGIADIVEFLDRLAGLLGSGENPPGCLIVNDMAADITHDATDRYLESLQSGILAALERASDAGETDPARNAQRSQTLTAAILGVNLAHRRSSDALPALSLIDGLRSEVVSWGGAHSLD
jgi:AcrR family transcriptional regulator